MTVMKTIDDLLSRLRAEFVEMPGLRLTPEQVQRLCGIEHTICRFVLASLVDERFLCLKPDGRYARLTEEEHRPSRRREFPRRQPREGRLQHRLLRTTRLNREPG
jgi:hypothetical protein